MSAYTLTRFKYLLLALVFCLLVKEAGYGQRMYTKTYSLEEGLPQSEVWYKSMLADKEGRLWIGTNGGGMVRMDGQKLTPITTKQGLPSNIIRGLSQDHQGNIWGLSNDGVFKYDGYSIQVYTDPNGVLQKNNFRSGQVFVDKHKNVWLTTAINLFRLEGDQFIQHSNVDQGLMAKKNIFGGFLDKDRNFWCVPLGEMPRMFDGEKFLPPTQQAPEWLRGLTLGVVGQDSQHNVWMMGFPPNNFNRVKSLVRLKDGVYEEVVLPTKYQNNLVKLTDIIEDKEGNLWIGMLSIGVLKYDGNEYQLFNEANSLPRNSVTCLEEDYEGNIWVGTQAGGLCLLPKVSFENFSTMDGLPGEVVFGLYEDSKDRIWVGTASSGFCTIEDGEVTTYPGIGAANLLRVDAFWEEPSGDMLIGSRGTGINRFDGKKLTRVETELGLPRGAGATSFQESEGILAISSWGAGVVLYDVVEKQPLQRYIPSNGLPSRFVCDIKKDIEGNYWVATMNGPAYCKQDTCIAIPRENNEPWGVVLQLEVDAKGRVWIVTFDQGLFSYLPSSGELHRYEMTEDNPLGLLYSVVSDEQGDLWIGTQTGIQKASVDENGNIGEVVRYSKSDGLSGLEMNGHAALASNDGSIWFGHVSGLSTYHAEAVSFNETPPITNITAVKLMGQTTNWKETKEPISYNELERWYDSPIDLSLPYDQNYLSFEFASLTYQSSKKVKRQWMLEGVDRDWLEPSDNNEATYSNLPYGTHVFKVRSMNSDGVWGVPDELAFTVERPFWETRWFQGGVLLLIVLLVLAGFQARLRAIRAKKEELEQLVHERTLALQERNQEVSAKNEELQQQQEEILAKTDEIERQNSALSHAYLEIEEKNSNITASIAYAKRIQEALLPSRSKFKKAFDDFFIFYKPRDIVSGDFFWFDTVEQQGEEVHIFASADCTGHGVPGAFMSMAGDAYLRLAVKTKKLTDPGSILMSLDEDIVTALQHKKKTANRDGMDISLCSWEPSKNRLRFAGAKNPLVYVKDGEIHQVKGTKRSIGDSFFGKNIAFETEEITVDSPIALYIFSDGYVDQFGGAQNRKFLIKNFRELLLDIHYLPMLKQREIIQKQLNEWMGDYRQIDDILVMGIQLNPVNK